MDETSIKVYLKLIKLSSSIIASSNFSKFCKVSVETIEICNKYYANDFVAFNYEIIEPEEFKPIYFEYKPKLI